jgi:hypothetical protein
MQVTKSDWFIEWIQKWIVGQDGKPVILRQETPACGAEVVW